MQPCQVIPHGSGNIDLHARLYNTFHKRFFFYGLLLIFPKHIYNRP